MMETNGLSFQSFIVKFVRGSNCFPKFYGGKKCLNYYAGSKQKNKNAQLLGIFTILFIINFLKCILYPAPSELAFFFHLILG